MKKIIINRSLNNKKQRYLIDSAIFEKIFNQQICDGADDEPHVVRVRRAGQVTTHLRTWNTIFNTILNFNEKFCTSINLDVKINTIVNFNTKFNTISVQDSIQCKSQYNVRFQYKTIFNTIQYISSFNTTM